MLQTGRCVSCSARNQTKGETLLAVIPTTSCQNRGESRGAEMVVRSMNSLSSKRWKGRIVRLQDHPYMRILRALCALLDMPEQKSKPQEAVCCGLGPWVHVSERFVVIANVSWGASARVADLVAGLPAHRRVSTRENGCTQSYLPREYLARRFVPCTTNSIVLGLTRCSCRIDTISLSMVEPRVLGPLSLT